MKHLNVEIDSPLPELPEYQSPETIKRIIGCLNTGDVVHLILQGHRKTFFDSLEIPQIHGAVSEIQPNNKPTIFSTYFVPAGKLLVPADMRTFAPEDIRLVEVESAEEYIPKASRGKFTFNSKALVQIKSGETCEVVIQAYFDGIVQSVNENGEIISGGASFFKPIA